MFGRKKKVCVVTACGKTKRDVPLPARKLYKSARITAVHNRKSDCDMYILSAKHGLIPSEKVIEPYDMGAGQGQNSRTAARHGSSAEKVRQGDILQGRRRGSI